MLELDVQSALEQNHGASSVDRGEQRSADSEDVAQSGTESAPP